MNKEQQIEYINKLKYVIESFEKELERIEEVIPGFFDTDLIQTVTDSHSFLISATAELTGISKEAIEWFYYECDWSKEPKIAVTTTGEETLIDSIEAFVEFENKLEGK